MGIHLLIKGIIGLCHRTILSYTKTPFLSLAIILMIKSLTKKFVISSTFSCIFFFLIVLKKKSWCTNLMIKCTKKPKIKNIWDLIVFFFNIVLFIAWSEENKNSTTKFDCGLEFIFECFFLFSLKKRTYKFFSCFLLTLYIVIRTNALPLDKIILIFINIVFLIHLQNPKHITYTKKNILIKNTQKEEVLAADMEEKSNFLLDLVTCDSLDLIFVIEKNLNILWICQRLGEMLKTPKNKTASLMNIAKLFKNKFYLKIPELSNSTQSFIKKSFFSVSEDIESINMGEGDYNEKLFEELMETIFEKKNENCNYILEGLTLDDMKEVIMIKRVKSIAIIKIKKDLYFKECINFHNQLNNFEKMIPFVEHELRTPLNCIVSMLQALETSVEYELGKNCIYPALVSSKFLLHSLNDMIDILQLASGSFRLVENDFELSFLLEDTLQMVAFQAQQRGIELKMNMDPKIKARVRNDPNRIRQIVTNFLRNALSSTNKGSIVLSSKIIRPKVIEISVEDTGHGIPRDKSMLLLKSFSEEKLNFDPNILITNEWANFGLLISNFMAIKLSELNLGINFQSEVGKGSSFRFCFDDLSPVEADDLSETFIFPQSEIYKLRSEHCKFIKDLQKDDLNCSLSSYNRNPSHISSKEANFLSKEGTNNKNLNYGSEPSSVSSLLVIDSYLSKKKVRRLSLYSEKRPMARQIFLAEGASFKDLTMKSYHQNEILLDELNDKIAMWKARKECSCPFALIIDDNDFNILALAMILKKMNVDFDSALSCDDAMQKINDFYNWNCCKYYKVIFLDIEMPVKDGFQTYEEIAEFYDQKGIKNFKIIAVTAHNQNNDLVGKMKRKGVNDVLSKPLTKEVLILTLSKFMNVIEKTK